MIQGAKVSAYRGSGRIWTERRIFHITLVIPAFLLYCLSWYQAVGLCLLIVLLILLILPQPGISLYKDPGRGYRTPSEKYTPVAYTALRHRPGVTIAPHRQTLPPETSGPAALPAASRVRGFTEVFRGEPTLYPISILIVALIFHRYMNVVAAAWAALSLGDGFAGAIGEHFGRHALPYNRHKTWEGFFGFIVFGAAGIFLLMLWAGSAGPALKVFAISIAAGVVGAFVESLPIGIDDNLTVPLVCSSFVFCTGLMTSASLYSNLPYLRARISLALLVNLLFALAAWKLRQTTFSGAAAGFFLGTAVYAGFGYRSFAILLAFFVLGSAATRLGAKRKMEMGIAEGRRGARGWREAVANVLAAAFFSLLAITTPDQAAFLMALVAALAEAAGDTVASETGKWASSRAWLITNFKRVPPGENGGVSPTGTAAGFGASGLVVGLASGLGLLKGWEIVIVLLAAIAGNAADSLLGATLERRGWLTNGIVNFAGTSIAGALALVYGLHR